MPITKPTIKVEVRAQHRQALNAFLDARGTPFRRQDLAAKFYPMTTPRSRERADALAKKVMDELAKEGKIVRHGHLHWEKTSAKRSLRSGREIPELSEPMTLTLKTRCPEKWAAVDLETGEIWMGSAKSGWTRPTAQQSQELGALLSEKRKR